MNSVLYDVLGTGSILLIDDEEMVTVDIGRRSDGLDILNNSMG